MIAGLSGMVKRGLYAERMMMDAHMVVALSGIVGGVDGIHGKVNALIPILEMGPRKMVAATYWTCAIVLSKGLLDQFVLLNRR
jgi:hypothetical protein